MHQPGFTHFFFWRPGSEGSLRPRGQLPLPASPLLVAFTSQRGAAAKFPRSGRGQAARGSSLKRWGVFCAELELPQKEII